jgi:hypothetical protein
MTKTDVRSWILTEFVPIADTLPGFDVSPSTASVSVPAHRRTFVIRSSATPSRFAENLNFAIA